MSFSGFEQASLWHLSLVFMRVGAAAGFLPGIGERFLPVRVRLAAALVVSFLVWLLGFAPMADNTVGGTTSLWISEISVGVIIGLALRLFLNAVQIAGSIAAQSTSLAQIYGGQSAEPLPAIGHLLTIGALALAMISGYPLLLLEGLRAFYAHVPIGQIFPSDTLLIWGVALVGAVFRLGFVLAAPFVIASVVYNLTIGLINKAMPQMMVAFVGAPFITFLSLVLLAMTVPAALEIWRHSFFEFLAVPGVIGE